MSTRYNTGNPIESTDVRDMSDNAKNLDIAINTLDETWNDRFGVTRTSIEGAVQGLSFFNVGTCAAGYTLTNSRQTLTYSGHEYGWSGAFPKVVSAGSTPTPLGAGGWIDRSDVTLRGELVDPDGAGMIGLKHSLLSQAVATNLQDWTDRQIINIVSAYSVTESTPDIVPLLQEATDVLSTMLGGGEIYVDAGTWNWASTYIAKTGVVLKGAGKGITKFRMPTGTNVDMIKTDGYGTFSSISAPGVPHNYGLVGFSLDGNYLAQAWNNPTNTVNNSIGYGLKSYGFNFTVDIEMYNIPEVGYLFEGEGSPPTTAEGSTKINAFCRVSGKEGFIMRGPGDVVIETAFIGLGGILPMPAAASTVPVSSEYKTELVTLVSSLAGVGAYGTAYLNSSGQVVSVYVDGTGSGYAEGETVSIVPRIAGGTGATGTVSITTGNVVSVTVTAGGSGYVNRAPIDGMVFEDVNVEIGTVHSWAHWAGTGFRVRNGWRTATRQGACRLEGNHVISESNRQQVHIESATYGFLSLISCRNMNGVHPNSVSVPPYPGVNQELDSIRVDARGYRIAACQAFRTSIGKRIVGVPALIINGNSNIIDFEHRNVTAGTGDPEAGTGVISGDAVRIYGKSNSLDAALQDVKGDGVMLAGSSNRVNASAKDGVGKAVNITSNSNKVDVTIDGQDGWGVYAASNFNRVNGTCTWQSLNAGSGSAFHNGGTGNTFDVTTNNNAVPFSSDIGLGRVGGQAINDLTRTFTIASDAIQITTFDREVRIDTEGGAAADELRTITGGGNFQRIMLYTASSSRVVTVKDNLGNLRLSADFVMNSFQDRLFLNWDGAAWIEESRSDNT